MFHTWPICFSEEANSRKLTRNYELQGAGDVSFNKLQQTATLTWDQSSTNQSNSIPTLPSAITPAAQWEGKYLVMDKTKQDKTRQDLHPFPSLNVTKLVVIYQKAKHGSVKNKVIWGLKLLGHPGWMPLVHGSEDFIQNNRQTHRRLNPPHHDAHFLLPSILLFIRIILYCLLRKQLRNYV